MHEYRKIEDTQLVFYARICTEGMVIRALILVRGMDSGRGIKSDNTVEDARTSPARHAVAVEASSPVIYEDTQLGSDVTVRSQTQACRHRSSHEIYVKVYVNSFTTAQGSNFMYQGDYIHKMIAIDLTDF